MRGENTVVENVCQEVKMPEYGEEGKIGDRSKYLIITS